MHFVIDARNGYMISRWKEIMKPNHSWTVELLLTEKSKSVPSSLPLLTWLKKDRAITKNKKL